MTDAGQHYLWACLHQYRHVGTKKYRRDFNGLEIENRVKRLGLAAKRTITYEDLRFFEAETLWPFEEFSSLPPKEKVCAALKGKTFDFQKLPDNEAGIIRELLKVVRSIEVVSIILRFVKPEDYGIISPPVEKVLEVRRGESAVKTYRYYLENLRQIREHLHFPRTADVDMALWVLHEKCFGHQRDPEIRRNYLHDELLRSIRIRNLVSPLPLDRVSNAQLAEVLRDVKPNLAALVACYELETLIRRFAELKAPDLAAPDVNGHLPNLSRIIRSLASKGFIDRQRETAWWELKQLRDNFFHKAIEPKERTDFLVGEVNLLEQDLAVLQLELGRDHQKNGQVGSEIAMKTGRG